MSDPPLARVRLLELPAELHERFQAHLDGLLREFRLALPDADVSTVPVRALTLMASFGERYAAAAEHQSEAVEQALATGTAVVPEVVLELPAHAAGAAAALDAMLDEADAYCAAGQHLLMLAAEPEVARYRHWYLSEYQRQIAGDRPTPWPSYGGRPDPAAR